MIPVDLVKYSSEILVNGEWESFWTNPVERDENVSTTGGPRGAKTFSKTLRVGRVSS